MKALLTVVSECTPDLRGVNRVPIKAETDLWRTTKSAAYVWLRTFEGTRAGIRRWTVYMESGGKRGAVDMPEALDVSSVRGKALVGILRRDGESDLVVRHELVRRIR